METTKKASRRTKRNPEPITDVIADGTVSIGCTDADIEQGHGQVKDNASIELTQPETQAQPPQQNQEKPRFEADNSEVYRALLLERPGIPFISTIQEAIVFVEAYQKWNRKVQTAFK